MFASICNAVPVHTRVDLLITAVKDVKLGDRAGLWICGSGNSSSAAVKCIRSTVPMQSQCSDYLRSYGQWRDSQQARRDSLCRMRRDVHSFLFL